MLTLALSEDQTGCVILDTLKPLEFDTRKADQKGIAVVPS